MKNSFFGSLILLACLSYSGNALAEQSSPAFELKQADRRTTIKFVKTGKSLVLTDKVVKTITSMDQIEELGGAKAEAKVRLKDKEGYEREIVIWRQANLKETPGLLRVDTQIWDEYGYEGGETILNRCELFDAFGKKLISFQSYRGYVQILNREGYFSLIDNEATDGKVITLMTPVGKEITSFNFTPTVLPSITGRWAYVRDPLSGKGEYLVELHTGKMFKGRFDRPEWRISRAELDDNKTMTFKGGSRRKVFISKFIEE